MQTPKRKRYQKDAAPSDDIITLIHLVRQNPALYNYKLQPNQRRRSDILNGWAQIAVQIGNKYTVEECRRKWKNLRDTYHQYRLRKPKVGDGLSKWRYAKELEFLSTVYQPKLKSHRVKYDQHYGMEHHLAAHLQEAVVDAQDDDDDDDQQQQQQHHHQHHHHQQQQQQHEQDDDDDDDGNMVHHHANLTLVSDDAETFILHAYEESVNDDVESGVVVTHTDANGLAHIELTHDDDGGGGNNVEDVEEIVKHEHANSSLDEDGATGAEVDYEEVCMYEEAGNAPSVDSETIIGDPTVGGNSSPNDSKAFQYINTTEFCIEPASIVNAIGGVSTTNGSINSKSNIFKTISVLATNPSSTSSTTLSSACATSSANSVAVVSGGGGGVGVGGIVNAATFINSSNSSGGTVAATGSFVQLQPAPVSVAQTQRRDELDLFFEFLKNKMQRLSQVDITGIQIEFLNCVLRREAESAQKSTATQ